MRIRTLLRKCTGTTVVGIDRCPIAKGSRPSIVAFKVVFDDVRFNVGRLPSELNLVISDRLSLHVGWSGKFRGDQFYRCICRVIIGFKIVCHFYSGHNSHILRLVQRGRLHSYGDSRLLHQHQVLINRRSVDLLIVGRYDQLRAADIIQPPISHSDVKIDRLTFLDALYRRHRDRSISLKRIHHVDVIKIDRRRLKRSVGRTADSYTEVILSEKL